MSRSGPQIEFVDDKSALLLTVDLARQLDFSTKGLPFKGVAFTERIADTAYRCDVRLWFYKETETSLNEKLLSLTARITRNPFSFEVSSGRFRVHIPLAIKNYTETTAAGQLKVSFSEDLWFDEHSHLDLIDQLKCTKQRTGPRVGCRATVLIVRSGPPHMVVSDRREEFENARVISGGRPESDRRKF